MTVEASINADTLDTSLDILQSLVDEARLHLSPDGLRVSAVEPANVAMHNPLKIDSAGFKRPPTDSVTVGAALETIQDAIGPADPDQMVDLSFDEETRKLSVDFAGKYGGTLAAIDPDSIRKEPDTSQVELPNQFTIPQSEFADAVDYIENYSDHVDIHADPSEGEVRFVGEGDTDNGYVNFDADDFESASLDDATMSRFPLNYLDNVVSEFPGGFVTVECGEEFPMRLHYDFAEGDGHAMTMMAPRIVSE